MNHTFRPTAVTTADARGLRAAFPDYETMLVTILSAILDRYERDPGYPFINTKLDCATGRDFAPGPDPVRDYRGRGTLYGWIQGRGLEALAGHARWLPACSVLEPAERALLAARIDRLLAAAVPALEAIRARNNGHLSFMMTPAGAARTLDASGALVDTSLPADACNTSDLFYAKGLFAAADRLGLGEKRREALTYFQRVVADIESGRFYSDQVQLDPRNKVQPVPGRFSHGPRMLALEGFALLFERTGEPAWLEKAAAFIFHILERHVNRGRFPALQPLDFYEAVDARGNPWTENNVVLSDPGHALEFLGLATRDLLLLESHPALAEQFAAFLGSCREILPGVFAQNFHNGFQPVAAGICKAYDLVSRAPINSDMPWWSLPETLRAGALLLKFAPRAPERPAILAALRDCSNAFLTAYVNPAAHLMAYQTRDGRGRPADVVPATPDADPGFHTGLSIIDYMKALA